MSVEMGLQEGMAMTPDQQLLYAVCLFFSLSALLKWTVRRERAARLERSLRVYQIRTIEGMA